MRGKRVAKVCGWILGVIVVLLVAGFVTLRFVLPPEKLRAMVLPKLEQALGQSVEVGSIHLTVWSGFGIGVDDLRLGNRPGYRDERMLELDQLVLRIPLRPLLDRRLEIKKIVLQRPKVYIEKSAEGALNIAGLGRRIEPSAKSEPREGPTGRSPSATPAAGPVALPIPITLEQLTIEGAEVRYRDSATGFTGRLGGVDYDASMSVDRTLRDIRVRGRLSAGDVILTPPGLQQSFPAFDMELDHVVRVDMTESVLSLDQVAVSLLNTQVRIRGRVEDFVEPILHLESEVSADLGMLPVADGTDVAGAVRSTIRLEGPALKPEEIRLLGTILLDRISLRTPDIPAPMTDLGGNIVLKGRDLEIPDLGGKFGSSRFDVSCNIAEAVPFALTGGKVMPTVRFQMHCPHLNMDEFMPEPGRAAERPEKRPGQKPHPSEPEAPVPLPPVSGTGVLIVDKITGRELEAHHLNAQIEIDKGRVRVPSYSVDVYTGKIHGSAEADLTLPSPAPVKIAVTAEAVEANDFVSALTPFDDHLFGQLNTTAEFAWLGLKPDEIRRSLTGTGQMAVKSGRLANWEFARRLSEWIKFLEFENLNFNDLNLDFQIAEERIAMRPLKLKALDTVWKAEGWSGFDGALDYRVVAVFGASVVDKIRESTPLAGIVKTDIGRTELVFRVSGNARSPKFRWDSEDLQAAVKDRAEEKIRDLVEDKARGLLKEADRHLDEDVKDKAQDLLRGLLKPDSSDTTGRQEKMEDLKKEGEKLLKDLFGKKKPKE